MEISKELYEQNKEFFDGMKRPSTNFFPMPSVSGKWTLNSDLMFNEFGRFMERSHPGKECVGFQTIFIDGETKYKPVMIDKV